MSDSKITVVPATEWHLLTPYGDEEIIGFMREPIIAWAIELVENRDIKFNAPLVITHPITIDGYDETNCEHIYLRPDGSVVIHCNAEFDNATDALEEIKRRNKERRIRT